jgi:PhnB protein
MNDRPFYIRSGFSSLTAEVVVKSSLAFMEFCMSAFEAVATEIVPGPNSSVIHATLRVGDTLLFVADESPMARATTANLYLYVGNADATFERAIGAGATVGIPMADMPWGDRWGMVRDPFGNYWQIATHREDVSPEDIGRLMRSAPPGHAPALPRTPRDVVRSYFEFMNAGRWEEYLSLYADDVIMDEQMAGHHEGKGHVREAVGMLQSLQRLPNFRNELVQVFEDGDHAVGLWHMTLLAPNGMPVDCRGANYYWVQEGKIKYFSNFHDTVPYLPLFPNRAPAGAPNTAR